MSTYKIAGKQEGRKTTAKGEIFYEATIYYIPVDESDNLTLSSNADGSGRLSVDDVVTITITDQSDPNNFATYEHDFSNGCDGTGIKPIDPVNLNSVNSAFNNLRGKTVSVNFVANDQCGGAISCTDFFLSVNS